MGFRSLHGLSTRPICWAGAPGHREIRSRLIELTWTRLQARRRGEITLAAMRGRRPRTGEHSINNSVEHAVRKEFKIDDSKRFCGALADRLTWVYLNHHQGYESASSGSERFEVLVAQWS